MTNKVYLLCIEVDLGYHVVSVYADEKQADEVCEEKNERAIEEKILELITGCGYTTEQAVDWVKNWKPYWIEPHVVEPSTENKMSKSYFPAKIQYTDINEIVIVSDPSEIQSGRSFIVLETNFILEEHK